MKPGRQSCASFRFILLYFVWATVCVQSACGLDLTQCRNSLGMESQVIPDPAITASSSFDDVMVGPQNARIRTEENGGAWCPRMPIDQNSYEYLQIDLGNLMVITMVEIQGRFGNGQGREFTTEFLLEYQREDEGQWMRFKNKHGKETFQGNVNTYLTELRDVVPAIIAKRIRFIPCSYVEHACMRVEMYGCSWKDGVVSYSMRQGDRRGSEVDLVDFTYDGIISANYLHDGLGQLTDGENGMSDFLLDQQDLGVKGYEWVGWKNDTHIDQSSVTIVFKFDKVRNFSAVHLNCNNYFSKNVRVFRMAVIYHSVGGMYFTQMKDEFVFMRDSEVEYSRNVRIKLDHFVARYVKLELYFDAKWILISEVQFTSEIAHGDFPAELPPPTTSPTTTAKQKGTHSQPDTDVRLARIENVLETVVKKNTELENRIEALEEENRRLKESVKQLGHRENLEEVDAEVATEENDRPDQVVETIQPPRAENGFPQKGRSRKIPRIVMSADPTVAFTATLSIPHATNLGSGQTIMYNRIITNVGGAYHNDTGIFTAPANGIYVFSIETMVEEGDSQYLQLVHNGAEVIPTFTRGKGETRLESSSRIATLKVNRGDEVWVRTFTTNWHGDGTVHGTNYSSFSGWLIALLE